MNYFTNEVWFLVLVCALSVHSAYYHVQSGREFSASIDPNSNFGFSISYLKDRSKLIVGAPLADKIGEIFTCNLVGNDANSCASVDRTNITRFSESKEYDNQYYWYGASVKGADSFFVGCSPLFIEKDPLFTGGSIGTYGRCYSYSDPEEAPVKLSTISKKKRKENFILFEHGMDSFGWSLDIINSEHAIVVGSPAVISGRLMKINYKKQVFNTNGASSNTSYNFGYSLANGLFTSAKSDAGMQVAVGSTFGSDGRGKVTFVKDQLKGLILKMLGGELFGEQLGSMFGAVLCAASLSAVPGRTDLLVGAPVFRNRDSYNVGAVYVYIAVKNSGLNLKRKIVGRMSMSYFGSAIVSVGDLNNDKMDEIAIAAPYENDGRGKVYLYHGADIMSTSEDISPMQEIAPEPHIKTGFGFSLTALNDYDQNGCNELAIGAPSHNKVIVLRCPAAITIKLLKFVDRLSGPTNGENKIKKLDVCFSVEFPDKLSAVEADIQVTTQIHHDGAKLNDPTVDGVILIKIDKIQKRFCKEISIFMSGTTGNYNKELNYHMSATLLHNPMEQPNFKNTEVILTEHSELMQSGSILWTQECGDDLCLPNLKMGTSFSQGDTYTIGSSPSIDVIVDVKNTGDVAYAPCVLVSVKGATVKPEVCQALESTEGTSLQCKPRQWLRRNNNWNETVSVDTTRLTNEDKSLSVTTVLYNECGNESTIASQNSKVFKLHAESDEVVVNGRTDEGVSNIVNLTRSDIDKPASFQHIYTISNGGRTNWVNVKMDVKIKKYDFLSVSVNIHNKNCLKSSETDSEETYSCVAPNLFTDAGIEVKVVMQVVPNKISGKIGKETLTVYSEISVDMDGIPKTANVTSTLVLVEATIPIWIIVAASILALIILVIIVFILRECGFLKRKNKEELKKVRMSVRRQTMMRQSMVNGQRDQDKEEDLVDNEPTSSKVKNKKERRVVVNDF